MREASRDKATQLEEGGRKDNLERRQPSFGTVRGVAIRSDCLDALDWALAHSLNDDHSQTVWLGDAVCISHWDAEGAQFPLPLRDVLPTYQFGPIPLCLDPFRSVVSMLPQMFPIFPGPDPIDAWCGTLVQPPPAPEEEDDTEKPKQVAKSVCLVTYSFLRSPLQ